MNGVEVAQLAGAKEESEYPAEKRGFSPVQNASID